MVWGYALCLFSVDGSVDTVFVFVRYYEVVVTLHYIFSFEGLDALG